MTNDIKVSFSSYLAIWNTSSFLMLTSLLKKKNDSYFNHEWRNSVQLSTMMYGNHDNSIEFVWIHANLLNIVKGNESLHE